MSLKISRILHAGYVFESGETQIAFDTIFENPFSRNCYAFPKIEFDISKIRELKFAAVFISHHHDDHCSLESLNLLDRATPIYLYCIHEELFGWIRELGFTSVHSLRIDATVTVGPFKVTPRRALDADVDSLFQVEAEGVNVLNVVDSWIDDDTLAQLASQTWDMILWPFQTMREIEAISPTTAVPADGRLPAEWIEQLQVLKPRFVVPSSCQFKQEEWSWYNHAFFPISYDGFREQVEKALPQVRVIRMNPGTSVELAVDRGVAELKTSPRLEWICPVGPEEADYEYRPELPPPPTADIARKFKALTDDETARAIKYCEQGLLEKFRSLDEAQDPYFAKPRLWRLTVFDHAGQPNVFNFQIDSQQIEHCRGGEQPEWSTEIPLFKLWSALEDGESLTSLYMRIEAPPEADIVEDPLVRSLFTRAFGAYQLAQLKRIKGQ